MAAVITDGNKKIVSLGYNGLPQNVPDLEAIYTNREEKYKYIIHAEVNAILHLPPGWSLLNATGVDDVPGTWLRQWDLFDLFIVLIIKKLFVVLLIVKMNVQGKENV